MTSDARSILVVMGVILLAPVLAELVAEYIETGATDSEVFVADSR